MITIVYGPMGCGKTRNAERLARHFGATEIVDGWDGRSNLPPNCLALTVEPPPRIRGARVIPFQDAIVMVGAGGTA